MVSRISRSFSQGGRSIYRNQNISCEVINGGIHGELLMEKCVSGNCSGIGRGGILVLIAVLVTVW